MASILFCMDSLDSFSTWSTKVTAKHNDKSSAHKLRQTGLSGIVLGLSEYFHSATDVPSCHIPTQLFPHCCRGSLANNTIVSHAGCSLGSALRPTLV